VPSDGKTPRYDHSDGRREVVEITGTSSIPLAIRHTGASGIARESGLVPVKQYGGYARNSESSLTGAAWEAMSPHDGKNSGGDKVHRLVAGELGRWSLGCECFAY
jgi:hypothetical protein